MKRACLSIILATLALSACATPTVYMPAQGPSAVGYSEFQIEANRYRVTFRGGDGAPEGQVADYALLRAAELTLREGFDWFRIADRRTEAHGPAGPQVTVGGGAASFGRHTAVGLGLGMGFDLSGGPSLSRTIEVVLGRGAVPEDRDAYDARDVVRSVGPRAHGPGAG